MRKSEASFIALNRRGILSIGVLLSLAIFGIVAWQANAQKASENSITKERRVYVSDFNQMMTRAEYKRAMKIAEALDDGPQRSRISLPPVAPAVLAPTANPLIYVIDFDNDRLIGINADDPGTEVSSIPLTGLDTTNLEELKGIDFRPFDNMLYGIASKPGFTTVDRVIIIDIATGNITSVNGANTFTHPAGLFFGLDFNPTADLLRFLSDSESSLRLNPTDGTIAGTDTNLAYAAGDPNFGVNPQIVHTAYSNNTPGAAATTLYGIDSGTDSLVRIGSPNGTPISPNSGQLFTIGPLGVSITRFGAFDIQQGTGVAYASLNINSRSTLCRIDLATGAATVIGGIGANRTIDGLSIALSPTAGSADLSITKDDGVTAVTAGDPTTYTITASNAGPDPVVDAVVADTLPAAIASASWTCVGTGGATCSATGTGNINDRVNIPVGGTVTYSVIATTSAGAVGSIVNTATVTAPTGVTDPDGTNNSATDTDTINPAIVAADLSITKTDGVTAAIAGTTVTYTIVASNAGPNGVPNAVVQDTFPAGVTTVAWSCVGAGGGVCTANGVGNINDTVNLPNGASVTYTAIANISPSAAGTLDNTATVSVPAGFSDPTPNNNTATDSDTLSSQADLAITKDDGMTNYSPGGATAYTITVTNAGPSNVTGATVADTLAPQVTSGNWTCVAAGGGSCTASGVGSINDIVNLPVGGSVTYRLVVNIAGQAHGDLVNTATVTAPAGVTDPNTANNTATDADAQGAPSCSQTFDTTIAPALPDGWASAATGAEVPWTTTTVNPNSPPNAAFAPDPSQVGDTEMIAPNFVVAPGGSQVSFQIAFNMEDEVVNPALGYDGAVLEISINGGPYQDILAAGGSFVIGGYNKTISTNFGSPLGGRAAWSGLSGGTTAAPGYIASTVNLPAAANGQIVQLKWRAATDQNFSADGLAGVWIDSIQGISCTATAAGVTVAGRVLTPEGRGLRNARVFITDASGATRFAVTTSFGYYRFDDVEIGSSYVVGVQARRYRFESRLLQVFDSVVDVDFVGQE